MKCPNCDKDTEVVKTDKSDDSRNGKVYDRILRHCKSCDVWISVETPEKK